MTPGQRLARILAERGIGKSAFARTVVESGGGRCLYHNVYRWTNDREFTPENRARAARALGLAPDYFDDTDAALERDEETRAVFEAFLRRPLAALLTAAELDVLRSMKFTDPRLRPSIAVYETIGAYLHGLIAADEIGKVATENDAIDRTMPDKTPPRRR